MKNKFELVGRVSIQPKLIATAINKIPFVSLNLAVSKTIKDSDGTSKRDTDFFVVYCWNNVANYVGNYVKLGDLISVEGHIKRDKEYDLQRNMNTHKNVLVCDKVQVYARSKSNSENKDSQNKSKEKEDDEKLIEEYKKSQMTFDVNKNTNEVELTESDLPF